MARSTWKGPFVDGYLLKKIQKAIDSGKKDVIKTWSRRSTILPVFVGFMQMWPAKTAEHYTVNAFGPFYCLKRTVAF